MEDSKLLVERTKNKFYETKNMVNAKLGDHLTRSRSLLSDVNSSLRKSVNDDFGHSQKYFIDSFAPFKQNSASDCLGPSNNEAYRCSTRMASPTCMPKKTNALGMSETPRHVTQADWLLNPSNVTCKLSTHQVEDQREETPEMLLNDPADFLLGRCTINDSKRDEDLTELLRDDSFDKIEPKNAITDSNPSMAYDIVSSLDLFKTNKNNTNVYGSNDVLNNFLNRSDGDLESLTQMFGPNTNSFYNPGSFYDNCGKNCDSTKSRLSQLNDLFAEQFVNNSGVDFKEHSDALTATLLKLNEQDKLKEIELAPKVPVIEEVPKKVKIEPKRTEVKKALTYKDFAKESEPDLLTNFTVIRDGKLGRKMHKLSDFDKKYRNFSKWSSSVGVQTERIYKEPEPVPKKHTTNVKVFYRARDGTILTNEPRGPGEHSIYAQKLLSNLTPKLDLKLESGEGSGPSVKPKKEKVKEDDIHDTIRDYNLQILDIEREKNARWRAQREPIYDRISYNVKSGVRNSMMCRGGRRSTTLSHNKKLRSSIKDRVDELYYISPSNRKLMEEKEYYGYDFAEEDLVDQKEFEKNTGDGLFTHESGTEHKGPVSSSNTFNPIDHFELWWRANTKELNSLRDQLSI